MRVGEEERGNRLWPMVQIAQATTYTHTHTHTHTHSLSISHTHTHTHTHTLFLSNTHTNTYTHSLYITHTQTHAHTHTHTSLNPTFTFSTEKCYQKNSYCSLSSLFDLFKFFSKKSQIFITTKSFQVCSESKNFFLNI